MPSVGKKEFEYNKSGLKKAKKFAKKTGKKVTMSKRGKSALQNMFEIEQREAKAGKSDKETKADRKAEAKKKGKK